MLALAPALAAVWGFSGFVTQDGPAHLYNAHVLTRSLAGGSPFAEFFEVRWEPLPNWAGHAVMMALGAALRPRDADRAMTTLTLLAPATAAFWLRGRVAGWRGGAFGGAAVAALLAANVTWLLGFGSFLLGASAFAATLGVWWAGRLGGGSPRRAAGLAALVTLGYFGHLVSLGLTAAGLVVLEALTPHPGPPSARRGRALATLAGLVPLGPLGWVYLRLMRRGGGLAPEWKHLASPWSPGAWVSQVSWVDPVSLARRGYLPPGWAGPPARWHAALAPAAWLAAALALGLAAAWRAGEGPFAKAGPGRERRGWWALAALLLAAGLAGPDTLGASHGEYLQQRVVLLGLVALVPVVRLDRKAGGLGLAAALAATVALGVQTLLVWDYAALSDRTAGALLRSAPPALGAGARVATRLTGLRSPFRASPLLHADCALGVGTGLVIWSDYETRFYYFPVQFRPGLDRPDPAELEWVALHDDPADAAERARRWGALLDRHHPAIDAVVAWGDDPALDAATLRRYRRAPLPGSEGPVSVFVRDGQGVANP